MLRPHHMSDKIVGVLGLGRSGMAAAASLDAGGARIFLHDDNHTPDQPIPDSAVIRHWQDWPWAEMDMMVISPGIPHHYPAPHPAAQMATQNNVAIVSEIEIAMQANPAAQIVAITGTNGKSTTTALVGHCLAAAGRSVAIGGNIGDAACGLNDPAHNTGSHHDSTGNGGVIVLELSSYQLETTPSLRADCVAILNITPDHLERHNGIKGYVAAKARILQGVTDDGIAILGEGDEYVKQLAASAIANGTNTIIATSDDAPATHSTNPALVGAHNAENAAFALHILRYLGLDDAAISDGMTSFTGLPHRMQQVADNHGIVFVNDSKATNGEAAAKSLGAFDNIYWIAGGQAKAEGMGAAGDALAAVNAAYFFGSSASDFADEIAQRDDIDFPVTLCGTLDHATHAAFDDASATGKAATILLAPAAASFDQFDSFVARGNAFATLARKLTSQSTRGGAYA